MKTLIFFFLAFPLIVMGQCDPSGTGTLSAVVNGNSVILMNDTAERNCGSWYIMEVTELAGDTLKWVQLEQGGFALCLCHFNLSVTVDSLEAGTYFVKAYYTDNPFNDDTCYIGLISFTIAEQNNFNNFTLSNNYQSDCFTVGIENKPEPETTTLLITPNPAREKITVISGTPLNNNILSIFNVCGKKVLEKRLFKEEKTINISTLPCGVYFVRVQDEKNVVVAKMIKE